MDIEEDLIFLGLLRSREEKSWNKSWKKQFERRWRGKEETVILEMPREGRIPK